jgi:signal transduction histidine kinase
MPNNKQVRLRSLLILLTALGLLPLVLVSAWGIRTTIEQQEQQSKAAVLGLSRALASAVDAELESTISTLRSLSYHSTLVYGDLPAFYTTALESIRERPDWISAILMDNRGNVIFKTSAPYGSPDVYVNDPESVTRAIASRDPVVGKIVKGQRKRTAFAVRLPVIDNGNLNYVLSVAVKPDRMLEILRRQNVPKDWIISVVDASNLRVARTREQEDTVGTSVAPVFAALISGEQPEAVAITRRPDNEEVIGAYTRTSHHGWKVIVSAPTDYFHQGLLGHLALYGMGIAASLLICIVLALLIARRIAGSIDGLKDQAVGLVQGEPVKVSPSVIQEVNQMASALQAASIERIAVERERERLMVSLNDALATAEDAGMAKDNFLAILGHELRNPLAPMVAALDLMEARGETASRRERDIMRRQVDHMKRLVDDLLDVSRITRGKLQMRKEEVNLTTVVQQAIDAVQPGIDARGRALRVDVPQQAWVMGDEARLVQVVTNLLNNAMHFDQEGTISLRVEEVQGIASITVEDQGAGMSAATVEQIFKPFYQAPQSLARPSGGLGLGLAIVKSIVELHGGEVSVRSAGPGKGSAFTVSMPAIARPAAEAEPVQSSQEGQRKRIIIVDDNVDAADMLAELFRLEGHDVEVSHDGQSALRTMEHFAADVAILDIGLPDIDGFELARTVRTHRQASSIKLIALSGYGQESDKAKAAAAGFDIHLTKPVEMDELRHAVA